MRRLTLLALAALTLGACRKVAKPPPAPAPQPTEEQRIRASLGIPPDAKRVVIFGQAAHLDIDWQKTFDDYYASYVEQILLEARGPRSISPQLGVDPAGQRRPASAWRQAGRVATLSGGRGSLRRWGMARVTVKKFQSPDESRSFAEHGRVDILQFGKVPIGKGVFEPGWSWKKDIKPIAGTPSCEVYHLVYIISGRMRIATDDGQNIDLGPGDLAEIQPGHDAWVVGDQACVALDFGGLQGYAQARPGAGPRQAEPPHVTH